MPTEWLRADFKGKPVGVDRKENVLRGFVVAQEGPFKTQGRGEFDLKALKSIKDMINAAPAGLKSRFGHPTLSDDGLGKFLGRVKNGRLDTLKLERGGQVVPVNAVRGDLHFDQTALETPPAGGKPLGYYIMNLADSDSDAFSSSLVLETKEELRLEKDGTAKMGEDGQPLPPLWRPTRLHASDIVDTGDAVDGVLSANLTAILGTEAALQKALRFDGPARLACQLLDKIFPGLPRESVQEHCQAWLTRYLNLRYGEEPLTIPPLTEKDQAAAIARETLAVVRGHALSKWRQKAEDNQHALRLLERKKQPKGLQ